MNEEEMVKMLDEAYNNGKRDAFTKIEQYIFEQMAEGKRPTVSDICLQVERELARLVRS